MRRGEPEVTARRLRPFGTTIFTEMSALAASSGALNLGQGFPDTDGPREIMQAVSTAMRSGANQYAPLPGVPELRRAIAEHQLRRYGLEVDPDAGVQVTFGATEAIAATMLGLLEPGDRSSCSSRSMTPMRRRSRWPGASAGS